MEFGNQKIEVILRFFAALLLLLTAFLVAFDTETQYVLFDYRKASFQNLNALFVLVCVDSVAAGYYVLQLCNSSFSKWFGGNIKISKLQLAWACFLLDQIAVYITFGATSAGLQASLFAITGEDDFQWMKMCNKFKRFCFQIGGALFCSYLAFILMISISFISAFNLFRNYSFKSLLLLKPTQ